MTLRDNQSSTKLLRATIIAAIIIRPRHCLAILIAAHFLPRLPRYILEELLSGRSVRFGDSDKAVTPALTEAGPLWVKTSVAASPVERRSAPKSRLNESRCEGKLRATTPTRSR